MEKKAEINQQIVKKEVTTLSSSEEGKFGLLCEF